LLCSTLPSFDCHRLRIALARNLSASSGLRLTM
jgi:hypothetical protein